MKKFIYDLLIAGNKCLVLFSVLIFSHESFAQLVINPNGPAALATQLAGPGVSVFNVTYTGSPSAAASFTATGTNLGLTSGIILATGPANIAIGPNNDTAAGIDLHRPGDAALDSLAGTQTYDAAILEFDFIPQNDTVNFRYVFGSEEYPEWVCSQYNDVFAFYISGPGITGNQNMALIPGTALAVAINTVNIGSPGTNASAGSQCILGYSNYYVDNTGGATIQYDGFTTVMVASAVVIPCQTYHLRLAIADAGDGQWDSGVLLEEGSLSSTPVVDAGPDYSFCAGQTVSIGGNPVPGWNYSWTPATGISNPNIPDPTLTLNPGGSLTVTSTYTVTATNGSCVLTDEMNATVTPLPVSTFTPAVTTICNSTPVQFDYTGNAPANATYNWNFGGGTIISGSGQGPYSVSFSNTGTYSVSLSVTDNGCVSVLTNAQVTVNSPPVATFTIPPATCVGDTLSMNFTGLNPATTVSLWNFNGANIISGNGLGPYQLSFNQAGTYNVSLNMNEPGCPPDSFAQVITVGATIATAGPDVSFCSGVSATIGTLAVAGTTYLWTPSNGLSDSTLATPVVSLVNPGNTPLTLQYILTAQSGNCPGNDTVSVTVNPQPVSLFSVLPDTICTGDSALITFSGNASPTAGFNWNFAGGNILSGSGAGPFLVQYNSGGTNSISLDINDYGCLSSTSDQLFIQDFPTAAFTLSPAACYGDTVQLNFTGVSVASSVFNWNFGNASVISGINQGPFSLAWNSAGTFPVTLNIANGNCAVQNSESITITQPSINAGSDQQICSGLSATIGSAASINYTYSWSPATGLSNINDANPVVTLSNANTVPLTIDYVCTATENGCIATDTVSVTVNPVPVADAGLDTSMCSGNSVDIGGIAQAGNNYQWFPSGGLANPAASNTSVTLANNSQNIEQVSYSILVTNLSGCTSEDSVTVSINPMPQLHFTAPPPQCIQGNSFDFSSTGIVLPGTVYHWYFGPTASVDSSNAAMPSSISYPATGNYNVILFGTYDGCPGPQEMQTVIVNPMPAASFFPDVTDGCAPLTVHFTNTSLSNTVNYNWYVDGNIIHSPELDWTFNSAGTYDVNLIATSNNGCTANDLQSHLITVYSNPIANFSATPPLATYPDSRIFFNNLSEGGKIYAWNFGDGGTENFFEGQHYYSDTGTYTVTLYVSTIYGCRDTVQGRIRIEGDFTFFIPDAFTPNGDGVNDSFQGYGTYVSSYQMWIYDRWGKMIYFTDDYNKPWDGRMVSAVQNDTYVYRIAVNDLWGKDHVYIGSVTLVR